MRRWLDRLLYRLGYVRRPVPPHVVGEITDLEEARRLNERLIRTWAVLDTEVDLLHDKRSSS